MFIIDYNDFRYSYTGQNVLTKKFNFRLIKRIKLLSIIEQLFFFFIMLSIIKHCFNDY